MFTQIIQLKLINHFGTSHLFIHFAHKLIKTIPGTSKASMLHDCTWCMDSSYMWTYTKFG